MNSRENPVLLTIGYEGLDLHQFIRCLDLHHVGVVVDVREIPLSRKKGFSKSALAEAMAQHGIDYRHIKTLGSPSPIRRRLRTDWNYNAFFDAFDEHLDSQDEALSALMGLIERKRRVCLLCFEKAHEQCHRSRVADRMAVAFGGRLDVRPVAACA